MAQYYYVLEQIPDLSLSKYSSLDQSGVAGVLTAHSSFWRQLNRRGLFTGESFHLFYEYDPQRRVGNKLRIGLRFDTPQEGNTFIAETIASSALSPFYHLKPLITQEDFDRSGIQAMRPYRYSSHLIKRERFLSAIEYGREQYYLCSEWEMNETARLYTMDKLMASIDRPCLYVVSIYPREYAESMTTNLDQTLNALRNAVRPQVSKNAGGIGVAAKDEHAKSTLDYYEDLLESLSENPHFVVDVQVLSDDLQHACLILDAAASEALSEGSHDQRAYEQNLSLCRISQESFVFCANPNAPQTLRELPQLFILEELVPFAVFPALYPGEWIELAKETVPEDYESGLSLGKDETGHEVFFPLKNLSKHAFLAGVPGSGKTNSMMHLIGAMHGTYKIPVLIFEPAKHEYRAITCVPGLEDVELFSPSASTRFPLHINPFEFPQGMTLAEHIRNLIAVFDGAFSLEPPMPFLLDASVEEVYADMGWSPAMVNLGALPYPTMSQLYRKLADRLEKTDYGPEIKGNLKSALQVRIGSLITREMADIFDVPQSSVKPEDWLSRSAIIELESLGKDPANFTTLLVATLIRETLKTINYIKPKDGRPRHVMFFEEAHNLIGPCAEKGAGQNADPKIAATAYIVKMLAEVRALGEGIVIADQLPTAMAPEVIKNTSLKIGLRITAQDDRQLLGGTMNANPDQLEKLSIFNPGHAIVSYEPLLKPFEVQLPYFVAKEGDLSDKTVLTSMLKGPHYMNNILRSIDICAGKWAQDSERIRKEIKRTIAQLEETDARIAASVESGTADRKLIKKKEELTEQINDLRAQARKLSLSIISYFTPLMFFLSPVPSAPELGEKKTEICNALKNHMRFANTYFDEILALINEYRIRKGHPQATGVSYTGRKNLFTKSAKTWDRM
ncbi:MAG: hypothetical protein IKU34_02270 [Clostridia bacterium]|nr:hypothetical protein [Clostridia bacterium]